MQPSQQQIHSAWQQTIFPSAIDVRSFAQPDHAMQSVSGDAASSRKSVQHGSSHVRSLLNGSDLPEAQHGQDLSRSTVIDGSKVFDLPELPVRNGKAARPRLPPTLSGLHEPPPNAGLLPSISTTQPYTAKRQGPSSSRNEDGPGASDSSKRVRSRGNRNNWTTEETAQLLAGVSKFGIGSWTKILKHPDFTFNRRTALDLKDRFRVCCPDKYGSSSDRKQKSSTRSNGRSARLLPEEIEAMGIDSSFEKTKRRGRHKYSSEEDAALLQGFNKHGKSWADIQQDQSLHLSHRTRSDLRDRMRTRYPDLLRSTDQSDVTAKTQPGQASSNQAENRTQANAISEEFYQYSNEDFDTEAVTLDTKILDWALRKAASSHEQGREDFSYGEAITQNADKQTSPLPPLSTVTGNGLPLFMEQHVPSLPAPSQYLQPDNDDRAGVPVHAFLSLEELLT